MKSRLSSLDIFGITKELSLKLTNVRLQNIYDYNTDQKTFIFKFNKPDFKLYLVIESGVRLHQTEAYQQEDARAIPSHFVAKLRKHLRNRRLTGIRQLGFDRIVELEFAGGGGDEGTLFVVLEFFSLGNVIVTDYNRQVLALLRVVRTDTVSLKIGDTYCMDNLKGVPSIRMEDFLMDMKEKSPVGSLKKQLSFLPSYVYQYIVQSSDGSEEGIACVAAAFLQRLSDGTVALSPALVSKDSRFIDFHCVHCDAQSDVIPTESVNQAADMFFSQREAVECENKEAKIQRDAATKMRAIETEQLGRITAIEASLDKLLADAQAMEANIAQVESACLVVRTCLENGMSWDEVQELLEDEKRKGRATASTIHCLKLASDCIEMSLRTEETTRLADVNIFMSAHANASAVYEHRKTLTQKLGRTKAAYAEAMKSASEKIKKVLREHATSSQRVKLQKSRKTFWFERFAWFITSDSYLVLGGKDAQQNEILVKKYLRASDVYVHAEISGAASIVVRNHLDFPIPERSLAEAGILAVCMSRAWEAKIVVGAWWVGADQVSKTAPSGEFLTTGSFMIRGHKNFLPPVQLQLGYGFMLVTEDPEIISSRRQKRIDREEMRRNAHKEGAVVEDDETSATMKRYEDAIDTSKMSDLSIVESSSRVPVDRSKRHPQQKEEKPVVQAAKAKGTGQPRGKKGKLKKIKEKYGDQDEEERSQKMKLLASHKQPPKAVKKSVPTENFVKKPREADTPKGTPQDAEDIVDASEDVAVDEVNFLDSLLPDASDECAVTQVVPVLGPWNVVRNYSHRVKFVPGGQKKSKVVHSAASIVSASAPDRLKTAIKAVPDTDLVQCAFVKSASLALTVSESGSLKKNKHRNKEKK